MFNSSLIIEFINQFFKTFKQFLKVQLLGFLGSYAILFISFSVFLNLPGAWLWSLLLALFNALPILDSSMILLPWAFITLFSNPGNSLVLILTWLTVLISQELILPLVSGQSIGIGVLEQIILFVLGFLIFGPAGAFAAIFIGLLLAAYRKTKRHYKS